MNVKTAYAMHRPAGGWRRRARRCVGLASLSLALTLPLPAQAQAPFPIPVPASIAVVPLLLLAVPIGIELSRSESSEVRQHQRLRDWRSLVTLATRELARHPGDVRWLSVRGRALQRLGECEAAMRDLRPLVTDERSDPAAVPGLPHDVRAAIAEAVRACDAWLAVEREAPVAEPVLLRIGARTLSLPGAGWVETAAPEPSPVRAAPAPNLTTPGGTTVVPLVARAALAVAPSMVDAPASTRRVSGALVWSGNPRQAYGLQVWSADLPCRRDADTVDADSFRSHIDAPECLLVRRTGAAGPVSPSFAPARAEAAARGAAWPDAGYEVHYARYGVGWLVTMEAWIPAHRLPGDAVAAMWARALAERLHTLAAWPDGQAVELPALGR